MEASSIISSQIILDNTEGNFFVYLTQLEEKCRVSFGIPGEQILQGKLITHVAPDEDEIITKRIIKQFKYGRRDPAKK